MSTLLKPWLLSSKSKFLIWAPLRPNGGRVVAWAWAFCPLKSNQVFPLPGYEFEFEASKCKIKPLVGIVKNPRSLGASLIFVTLIVNALAKSFAPSLTLMYKL